MNQLTNIRWHCQPFEQLSATQLYGILALREEVFVVEQNCPYQDADGKDFKCYHVWASFDYAQGDMSFDYAQDEMLNSSFLPPHKQGGGGGTKVLAYARIVKPGVSYAEVAIGRVVTSPSVRRTGLGKELVKVTLDCVRDLYGDVPIRLSAQSYLLGFYCSFGFEVITEPYMEDGIPHVGMVRPATEES